MPSQAGSFKEAQSKATPRGRGKKKGNQLQRPWLYDLVLWALSILIDLFFREVHPRGAWKVPKTGPVILVAAPHANQVGKKTVYVARDITNPHSLSTRSF